MNLKKYKNILVPIDFTDESKAGLKTAITLAQKTDATLHLLHVIDELSPSQIPIDGDVLAKKNKEVRYNAYTLKLIDKRIQDFEKLKHEFDSKDVEMHLIVDVGEFQEKFENYLKEHTIELVIMGTSGETAFSEFYTGNHAARAMRAANVPTLVVKKSKTLSLGDNRMLVLVDLRNYDVDTVTMIRDFAETLKLQVLLAHVRQSTEEVVDDIEQEIEKFAKNNHFKDYSSHVLKKGDLVEQIRNFATEWEIDIIASISAGNEGIKRLLYGSDTEKFIEEIEQPLLVVSES